MAFSTRYVAFAVWATAVSLPAHSAVSRIEDGEFAKLKRAVLAEQSIPVVEIYLESSSKQITELRDRATARCRQKTDSPLSVDCIFRIGPAGHIDEVTVHQDTPAAQCMASTLDGAPLPRISTSILVYMSIDLAPPGR